MIRFTLAVVLLSISCVNLRCTKAHADSMVTYKAKRCVIVLIDGPRWEETWGDTTHQYQPHMYNDLKSEGCIFTNFHNDGPTYTLAGHAALLTGFYQEIANDGSENPTYPTLPQLFLEKNPSSISLLITSKGKIASMSNCTNENYHDKFIPQLDCGIDGIGGGTREDSVTFENVKTRLNTDHPDFIFLHFKEPDASGHANDWPGYLNGIVKGDQYAWEIWNLIQSLDYYKDQTLFIVTNDHGRHPDGTLDGFVSHGDGCPGCRHINLFMAGPDIRKNTIITQAHDQVDVHATVCGILGLNGGYGNGHMLFDAIHF